MEMFHYLLLFVQLYVVLADWNYQDQKGWPEQCNEGKRQSPINLINPEQRATDRPLKFINDSNILCRWNFQYINKDNEDDDWIMCLNGKQESNYQFNEFGNDPEPPNPNPSDHTEWILNFDHDTVRGRFKDQTNELTLSGGDLSNNHYHFERFDLHYPSGHSIESLSYDYEVQLVFYNKIYGSYENALGEITGIVIVSRLFKLVDEKENADFFKILEAATKTLVLEDTTEATFCISILISKLTSYYTYTGSLVIPPCTEGVKWIIDAQVRNLGPKQKILDDKLVSSDTEHGWKNNVRTLQNLQGRAIFQVSRK